MDHLFELAPFYLSIWIPLSYKYDHRIERFDTSNEIWSYPETAAELFQRESKFRNLNDSLELTVNSYNFLESKICSVEFKLFKGELNEIDLQLERAELALNWNAEGLSCWWFAHGSFYCCQQHVPKLIPLHKNNNNEWQRHPTGGRLIANGIFSLIYIMCSTIGE